VEREIKIVALRKALKEGGKSSSKEYVSEKVSIYIQERPS
jgi:hypothetical protein